jgi:hypothetical protein
MSNATQDSRNPGDNRRRRSRGGQKRNKNNNEPRSGPEATGERREGGGGNRRERGPGSGSQGRRDGGNRAEEFRPQAARPARTYAPPKKTFLQKILSIFGLYKDPAPPSRLERKQESTPFPSGDRDRERGERERAPKSNTRNARSGDTAEARPPRDAAQDRGERSERKPREPKERAERPKREDRPRGGDPSSVESARVYVGNLSYDVTEQDLQELFKGVGAVRNVEIVYNRSTHRSKGYGFVEMLRKDEAVRAVEVLHDQHFMGRKMMVSGAKSKGQDEREDSEPEREPTRVVLAPTTPRAVAAQLEGDGEPGLENIEATGHEPVGEEIPSIADTDLEAKYGFDEPAAPAIEIIEEVVTTEEEPQHKAHEA